MTSFAAGEGESVSSELKATMVTDVGGVNDQSFNQSAWEGLLKAEGGLGVEVAYLESAQDADYLPNLQNFVDSGSDVIFGVGFTMADALAQVAKLNPNQKFAIVDVSYGDDTPDNVLGVVFKAEQPSFLVGYIAGKSTETGVVGFVGGISGFVIDSFDYGFHAGVHHANSEAKVLRQYADSFTDATKGKSIATQMYVQGADIVFHAAGAVGNGVIEAAREQGKWAIGVDRDQYDLAPDNILTSAMKRVGDAMYLVVEHLAEGRWDGGSTLVLGLKDGAVGISPTSEVHVAPDVLAEVEQLTQEIIDGNIVVPTNKAEYDQFIQN